VLTCPFCGQTHAFVPPPAERPPTVLQTPSSARLLKIGLVGFAVMTLGALAFSALVSERRAPSESTRAGAISTLAAHGPGDPKAVYAKGQAVDIHWGSSWWPGTVVEVDGAKYRAHYEGYGSGSDEWVFADRLRPRSVADAPIAPRDAAPEADGGDPNATYAVGEPVEIHWGSRWWPGSIKKTDGKRYRIAYDGYAESWDEWVTAERLRPRTRR
jgi:hypothetical protein